MLDSPDDLDTQSMTPHDSSLMIKPSSSVLNLMGNPASPFSTTSALGASLKSVSLEHGEFKKTVQEKRKLEHELKMKVLALEKKDVEIKQLKLKLVQISDQFEGRIKSLGTERDYLFESAKKSKEALAHALDEIEDAKQKLSTRSCVATYPVDQEKVAELERTVRSLRLELDSSSQAHQQAIAERATRLQSVEAELAEKNKKIERLQAEMEELMVKLDEAHIQMLMGAKRASEERDIEALQKVTFAKVNDAHQLEVEHRKLIAENEQLRQTAGSAKILEERLRDLQFQLTSQRKLEQRLAALETENQILKETTVQSAQESGPASIKASMEKTVQITKLIDEIGELRGSLKASASEIESLTKLIDQLRQSTDKSNAALKTKDSQLSQATEQLTLAKLEITMLKDQLNPNVVVD